MSIEFEPVVVTRVTEQIAEQIRQTILAGRLKADDRLPSEHELAEQFSVSRPTVREALKLLSAQNLVRSKRGPSGGTFVKRPTAQEAQADLTAAATLMVSLGEFDLLQISDARRELELVCGRLAALNRQSDDLVRMAAEIEMQKTPDLSDEDFCASEVRFHRALVDAAGNTVLSFVMYTVIEAVDNMAICQFIERRKIVRQHEKILAAVEDGNVKRAEKAISKLMA